MPGKADTKPGDKLRIVAGPYSGQRAIATEVRSETITARLDGSHKTVSLQPADVTNFSAAARKAWKTMPERRVGRPPGKGRDRISVTLRIDTNLWSRFREFESLGYIEDRSATIEQLITRKLALLGQSRK